jgi:long-chain acyl-CoA synthetase
VDAAAPESLQSPVVLARLQHLVAARLHQFPGYARIRRLYLTLEPWSVENGLLTPTLKLKRTQVMDHLQHAINQLYPNG